VIKGMYKNEALLTGGLCYKHNRTWIPYTLEELTKALLTMRVAFERERKRADEAEAKLGAVCALAMEVEG